MDACTFILILSGFTTGNKRVTPEPATRRSKLVTAADEQKILSGNARQLFRL